MDLAHPRALLLLTDLLARDAEVRFAVTGQSMRPFLSGGETVIVRVVRSAEIRRGDLLLLRQTEHRGGRLLLHRVVGVRRRKGLPTWFQTQGDALCAPDEAVAEAHVLGRVSAVSTGAPGAELISLDSRRQRIRASWIALRQRALWRSRVSWARLCQLVGVWALLPRS
jgi:signal peptidase I